MFSKEFRTLNIVSRNKVSEEGLEVLNQFLPEIEKSQDRRKNNYSLQNLDIPGHLEFDLLLDAEDRLVTFSGVYNGGRFPERVFRILNRVYVAPKWRTHLFSAYASKYLLPNQLSRSKDLIDFAFVSREKPQSKRFLKYWSENLAPDKGWTTSDFMIQVVPKIFSPVCFQYIAYRKYKPNFKLTMPGVTEEYWRDSIRENSNLSQKTSWCVL